MSFWTDTLGAEVRFHQGRRFRSRAIEAGEGDPVILLHGLGGHAESYIRNVVPLAAAGFRVYAVDAVGHGFTDKPTDRAFHAPLFREHLLDFMDAIGAGSAHLVGQSLGAWTAFDLARSHPERVKSLTSITGAGLLLEDDATRLESEKIHRTVRAVNQAAAEQPSREKVHTRLAWLMADPSTIIDELVDTRYAIYCLPDSRAVMYRMVSEQPGEDNRVHMLRESDLAKISAPTLFLWTDKNPSTPASVAERAARIMPRARFHLIKGAGHWAQFEQPTLVNELVAAFLREISAAP